MKIFLIFVALVLCAFPVIPQPVLASEGTNIPIKGEMEFIPAQGNNLGDVILFRVTVSYESNLVEFDSGQIPQALNYALPKLFEVRGVLHESQKGNGFTVADIWEFQVQFLNGLPPLTIEIPPLLLQYRNKGASYFSSFEIPGARVSFIALTSRDSLPEPIIRKLDFGPGANLKAIVLFSLAAIFILTGIIFGATLFFKKQKKKEPLAPQAIDEFTTKYNLLRSSFEGGEEGLIVLHKLYLLLLSFYQERRGIEPKMNWQGCLPEEEKAVIESFQKLYSKNVVSKFQTHQLFGEAKKILEKQ